MRLFTRRRAVFCVALGICAALFTLACSREPAVHPTLAVAAAANLTEMLTSAGPAIESQTGIHPLFSFASTAQLEQQIENAAPFDVFMAADSSHVDQLDQKHLLVPGSRAIYAIGVLALWIPPKSQAMVSSIQDLTSPSVRQIAIAKPELAPYGKAAVESLQAAGIWDKIQPKVVYAENIAMARQYGDSGNADAVFTAYSLLVKDQGKIMPVDEKLHKPIEQALGIVAASKNQDAARKFADYFLKGAGRDTLKRYGYGFPLQ